MANTKFGLNQLKNATPAFIGRLRKLLLYITGGIGVFIPEISDAVGISAEKLIKWGGISVFLLTGLCEFFGVPLESPTVATKDVTEVETN